MRTTDFGPRGIITMSKWWFEQYPKKKYYEDIVKKLNKRLLKLLIIFQEYTKSKNKENE